MFLVPRNIFVTSHYNTQNLRPYLIPKLSYVIKSNKEFI